MKETQASIYQWARETFGEAKDAMQIALRAREEFDEMIAAMREGSPPWKIVFEAADTVIVLLQVAEHYGLDLGEAIDRKMAINRAREWRTAGDGTGQHVEGVEA